MLSIMSGILQANILIFAEDRKKHLKVPMFTPHHHMLKIISQCDKKLNRGGGENCRTVPHLSDLRYDSIDLLIIL